MSVKSLILLFLCLTVSGVTAGPLNLRHPAPSPDGAKICFSYSGDLWIVSASGGKAERLTAHVGYDAYPSWSPDGRFIAFSSIRHGNFDVYVVAASGGSELRVTYHSADDFVSGWSPDSKEVIFDSKRELHDHCIFEVNPWEGKPHTLTKIESFQGQLAPDGKKLLFCRGEVPWWRKGYRGAAACDLFIKDLGNGQIGKFTSHPGNDMEGHWLPGGEELIYLSDTTGSYNIFKKNIRTGAVDQLTLHRLSASFPRVAADGSLISYELGGEIWLYDLRTGFGSKLEVSIAAGDKTNPIEKLTYDTGATEMALSPDGRMIAYVVAGEIFCMTVDGQYQQRLTNSVADDKEISWSADSREIIFVSDQDNGYDVYTLRSTDPNQALLARSHNRDIGRLMESDRTESQPSISPENSKVAFVRSQTELMVTDRRGLDGRKLSEKARIYDLSWSPDGRYLIFAMADRDWFRDIYIADSESGRLTNITLNPGNYSRPRFSPDGKMVYFVEDGRIFYLFLQRDLAEMAALQRQEYLESNGNSNGYQPVQIDFDGISGRKVRANTGEGVSGVVAPAGCRTLFYTTAPGNIWSYRIDEERSELLAQNLESPGNLQYDANADRLYFTDGDGRIYSLDVGQNQLQAHPYRAEVTIDYREQRLKLFEQAWEFVRQRFYDESLHGTDWREVGASFGDRAAAAENNYDLFDVIREMLGELKASHLGVWPRQTAGDETGWLGVIPDFDYSGNGMKIGAVVPGSPADHTISKLNPGEKITAVENSKVKGLESCYQSLDGTAGREILLDIETREGMTKEATIRPISARQFEDLEYDMWRGNNRRMVNEISKGRVGYVHLRQFDDATLDDFGRQLAVNANGKESLILDIRGNVGGSAHDHLLDLLANRSYVNRVPREGLPGSDSRRLFDGKILLLVNEKTTSDAEIFALGFRQLGLGTIAGTPTYGAVIGTETLTLLDGSGFALPSVGWYTLNGENLENMGVTPDLTFLLNLTLLEKGEDTQLRQAVEFLIGSSDN